MRSSFEKSGLIGLIPPSCSLHWCSVCANFFQIRMATVSHPFALRVDVDDNTRCKEATPLVHYPLQVIQVHLLGAIYRGRLV